MKCTLSGLPAAFLLVAWAACPAQTSREAGDYQPRFWAEGVADRLPDGAAERAAATKQLAGEVQSRGWNGIVYWGADRRSASMDYYFPSPFLERQEWARFRRDGLTPLVQSAHAHGLRVMINIEGVNPYHWKDHHWTPENIKMMATDLAAAGVDAVFEECFETKPEIFLSLARTLAGRGVVYVSGTDPMLLREPVFPSLWPETGAINIYNYYLKRDKIFNIASLTQHGSLGYGWAKSWRKPTALISPLNRDWGIATDFSPAVVSYLCLIRALQFRVDDFIIFGGFNAFDPHATRKWIAECVGRQEKSRPLLDVVVLLPAAGRDGTARRADPGWNRLFNSGDAITSGAFHGGYNVIVSNHVLPADAYWIYAAGGAADVLPPEVVALFATDKPVFLQCGGTLPSGQNIDAGWRTALAHCGIDATIPFQSATGSRSAENTSLPPSQAEDLPYTGYYRGAYLRFTGADAQYGTNLRAGTVIPPSSVRGAVVCAPNRTYGKGPFIVGQKNKYVVTATCLNWEVSHPISHLLSGGGLAPSSNVWGIVGKNVTALLAIETTELELTIPGLADGASIRVSVFDRKKQKTADETAVYRAPFKRFLHEYDLIVIEAQH